MASKFWDAVEAQLAELKDARTPDDVMRILSHERNPYRLEDPTWNNASGEGFFAGSGGDDTVLSALHAAGWLVSWMEASYYYVMRAPDDAGFITYCEGDVDRGDLSPAAKAVSGKEGL